MALADRLRLDQIDSVPEMVLVMGPDFLNTGGERQLHATVSSASCELDGDPNEDEVELRIGVPIQSMSADPFAA